MGEDIEEAKAYIEQHRLEKVVTGMLNNVIQNPTHNPKESMVSLPSP